MRRSHFNYLLFALAFAMLFIVACREENLKPGVPAFVKVNQYSFQSNYATQGTDRQKITDVWAFLDGQTLGVFALPATIPVLKEGIGELRLEAGIELNGITATRINNPFFEPFVLSDFAFYPDSVVECSPATTYRETTVFEWLEDFENPSVSLDTANLGGTAGIQRMTGEVAYEQNYSGLIYLDSTHTKFEAATFNSFSVQPLGRSFILELNYQNDHFFSVGIVEETTSQVLKSDIIFLYPSEEWNKVYINFTDELRNSQATTFKILFRSYLNEDESNATIYLDNIKLMYR
jgi:hypothetical protein